MVLLKENHKPLTEVATLNRKSGGAEGSAVRPSALPNPPLQTSTPKQKCHPDRKSESRDLLFPSSTNQPPLKTPPHPLSSRAYPDFLLNGSHRAAYVVLLKESHKPLTEVATLNRKSGGAEGSAVHPSALPNIRGGSPRIHAGGALQRSGKEPQLESCATAPFFNRYLENSRERLPTVPVPLKTPVVE